MSTAHPVKNESGGGFAFEDRAGGLIAAAMLAGRAPLETDLGSPSRIDFQVGANGWRLDDILVTFSTVRWCASIKSFSQIKAGTASTDFVTRAWEEVLGASGSDFDPDVDLVGMITAPLGQSLGDVQELIRLARNQEPAELSTRIEADGYVSADRRTLWHSFDVPDSISAPNDRGLSTSPGEVLRRLRVIEADFEHSPSRAEAQALGWCGDALTDPNDAEALWESLLRLVSDTRTAGGVLTRPILGTKLRNRFDLRDHPAYERDWATLREMTGRNIAQVADSLGGRLHVDRTDLEATVDATTESSRFVALVGPSGSGKTALAKASVGSKEGVESLWLQAHEVAAVAQPGGVLRHPVLEVLGAAGRPVSLVIDGLDRSFSDAADAATAQLITAIERDETLHVSVLVTSQQQEWTRVADRLADRNALVKWELVPVTTFTDEDLGSVFNAFPTLRDVVLRGRLTGVLRNPKVLDVVLRPLLAGGVADGDVLSGQESSFAQWFYERLARGSGHNQTSRGALVMRLAEIQGDRLQFETPVLDLDAGNLNVVDDLEHAGICEQRDARLRFAHDLYGDWVRHQLLRTHVDDLPESFASASRLRSGIGRSACTRWRSLPTAVPTLGARRCTAWAVTTLACFTTFSSRPHYSPRTLAQPLRRSGPSWSSRTADCCAVCLGASFTSPRFRIPPCSTRSATSIQVSRRRRRRFSDFRTGRSGSHF
jgi:hypothetical protein